MPIRLIVFAALAALALPCAASDCLPAQIALFYSFDRTPDPAVLHEMQSEFARIAAPAGFAVVWQEAGSVRKVDFADLYVVRFRGTCSADAGGSEEGLRASERSLGETSVSDGRVLPFADVQCDALRRYLPGGSSERMARAMARVTAHEMYHMMTGLASHGRHGIAQEEFSPADLITPRFVFGREETEILRARATARPLRDSL